MLSSVHIQVACIIPMYLSLLLVPGGLRPISGSEVQAWWKSHQELVLVSQHYLLWFITRTWVWQDGWVGQERKTERHIVLWKLSKEMKNSSFFPPSVTWIFLLLETLIT